MDKPVYGLEAMKRPELMPLLMPNGTRTKQFISYDPSGSNNDGNFDLSTVKYVDENGEFVIFDELGPGCLYRQQINVWWMNTFPATGNIHIRYYFDDDPNPVVDMSIDDFFNGVMDPVNQPLSFMDPQKRFGILYYPFAFAKRLKITLTENFNLYYDPYPAAWYQYTYLVYPQNTEIDTTKLPLADCRDLKVIWEKTGEYPGNTSDFEYSETSHTVEDRTQKTVYEKTDAGSINSLKLKIENLTPALFYNAHIKIYWDNSVDPAINLPLGYFFGGGGKEYEGCNQSISSAGNNLVPVTQEGNFAGVPAMELKTLFYGYKGTEGTFYSYWSMPFWENAKIVIENKSGTDMELKIQVGFVPGSVFSYEKDKTGYFFAKRTIDHDMGDGLYVNAFEETGRGHLVGKSFYTYGFAMDGDEFTYLDMSRTPQMHGDGTEDDHNQGFGGDAFQKPLWGGLINGFSGAYRIYMNEPYIFNSHIKVNYEFSRDGGLQYSGGRSDIVVYYYKSDTGSNICISDKVDIGNKKSEKEHNYIVEKPIWTKKITSSYDGYEMKYEYDKCTDNGRGFKGFSSFDVKLKPENRGVRIRRRLYRSSNGIQIANVYIDGKLMPRKWYTLSLSSTPYYQGWFDDEYEVPYEYTSGKETINIRIEYADSANKTDINEFYYWIFNYCEKDVKNAKTYTIKNLKASSRKSNFVELDWDIAPEEFNILYYNVYRSAQSDFKRPVLLGRSDDVCFTDKMVEPSRTYYYGVTAVDTQNNESIMSKIACESTPFIIEKQATAKRLDRALSCKGSWGGLCGNEGFDLLAYFYGKNVTVLPDWISGIDYGNFEKVQYSIWATSSPVSLMTSPVAYSICHLGGLTTKSSDAISIRVNDLSTHRISLYFCDYDRMGYARNQDVEIVDFNGNLICPAVSVIGFHEGMWLDYEFSGSIKIRVNNRNPNANATISGIFFDGVNLADKCLYSTSSNLDNQTNPEMAFDNNLETFWAPSGEDINPWIQIDFKEQREISKISVNSHTKESLITNYRLQSFSEGKWIDEHFGILLGRTRIIEIPQTILTEKLRVVFDKTSGKFPAICNIQVF